MNRTTSRACALLAALTLTAGGASTAQGIDTETEPVDEQLSEPGDRALDALQAPPPPDDRFAGFGQGAVRQLADVTVDEYRITDAEAGEDDAGPFIHGDITNNGPDRDLVGLTIRLFDGETLVVETGAALTDFGSGQTFPFETGVGDDELPAFTIVEWTIDLEDPPDRATEQPTSPDTGTDPRGVTPAASGPAKGGTAASVPLPTRIDTGGGGAAR